MAPKPWQIPKPNGAPRRAGNVARGRANKRSGAIAEIQVATHLRMLGLILVERREVGWRVKRRNGRVVGAAPMAKVSGDFTAVAPGGIYVHLEAKHHDDPDEPLSLSDFDKHQLDALADYDACAIALVAFSSARRVVILRWPVPGLARGAPIRWEQARALALTDFPRRLA